MRALKAKGLRRQAEAASVGLPLVNYVWKLDARGNKVNIVLSNCTRAIYQASKAST